MQSAAPPGHIEDPWAGKTADGQGLSPHPHSCWELPESWSPGVPPWTDQHSPATQAFTRDTQVPVQSARSTIWEKSLFRWGAMEAARKWVLRARKTSALGPQSAPLDASADSLSPSGQPEG